MRAWRSRSRVDADVLGVRPPEGLHARFRIYDFGVVSRSLIRPFRGSWPDLHALAQRAASSTLESDAERLCRRAIDRLRPAARLRPTRCCWPA